VVQYQVYFPVWWVYSVPTHTYKNKPRQISPGHREHRLAQEMKVLSEKGREDQLRHAVRQLYARADDDEPVAALMAALEAEDYGSLRKAVARYKREKQLER